MIAYMNREVFVNGVIALLRYERVIIERDLMESESLHISITTLDNRQTLVVPKEWVSDFTPVELTPEVRGGGGMLNGVLNLLNGTILLCHEYAERFFIAMVRRGEFFTVAAVLINEDGSQRITIEDFDDLLLADMAIKSLETGVEDFSDYPRYD